MGYTNRALIGFWFTLVAGGGVLGVVFGLCRVHIVHARLLELGIFQQIGCFESSAKEQIHVQLLDVLGHVKVVGILATAASVLNTQAKESKFVESHSLAFQKQLTQTYLHLDEHSLDGGLAEYAVVACHVLNEFVELHDLIHRSRIPFAISGIVLVCVFVKNVTYHKIIDLRFCGNIATAKVRLFGRTCKRVVYCCTLWNLKHSYFSVFLTTFAAMYQHSAFRIRQYGRTELAICYSPALTPSSAWRRLRAWITSDQTLTHTLAALGYDGHSRSFTPAQVSAIVEHLGVP